MRIAEILNNTKKRMMEAFDRRDRETVEELMDHLAYMVMENIAALNVYENVLIKERGKQLIIKVVGEIAKELDIEKKRAMKGYEVGGDKE